MNGDLPKLKKLIRDLKYPDQVVVMMMTVVVVVVVVCDDE